MFKVVVEKGGPNAHLQQKGKIAELALRYGGAVGALKAMGGARQRTEGGRAAAPGGHVAGDEPAYCEILVED